MRRSSSNLPSRPIGFGAVFGIALVTTAACASLNRVLEAGQALFEKPTLSFQRANVRDISLEGAALDLVFQMTNPNDVGLDLASVAYNLEVEGKKVVSGAPEAGLKIPAKGSSELTFPAKIKFLDLAQTIEAVLTKEESSYKASGEVGVNTPIGVIALPLATEGRMKNPRLPKLSLQVPRVSNLSFSGARLTLPIKIDNPNAFALPVAGITGAISVAGTAIGNATAGSGATIAAGQAGTVELGVDLSFLSVGTAVATAIRNGGGDVGIDGALAVGGLRLPVKLQDHLSFTN